MLCCNKLDYSAKTSVKSLNKMQNSVPCIFSERCSGHNILLNSMVFIFLYFVEVVL